MINHNLSNKNLITIWHEKKFYGDINSQLQHKDSKMIWRSQQINWTAWKITWNVAELSRPLIFNLWSGLLLHRKWKELWELTLSTGQNFIQWISSHALLLNNQFYPVDNFIQYFEQPGPWSVITKKFFSHFPFSLVQ